MRPPAPRPGEAAAAAVAVVLPEPVVFRAPLVTVPRAVTIAGRPPRRHPARRFRGAPPAAPGVTQPGRRRGSHRGDPRLGAADPGSIGAVPAVSAAAGQPTRLGAYPRGVMNPTVAEIAAVALPGVAGLIFLTFGGGVIGYRQANSVRFVRTAGAERFLA